MIREGSKTRRYTYISPKEYGPHFRTSLQLRINDNVKATAIIQGVDVLKAISWIKSAWDEVSEETIVNCFKKCGFRKSQPDVQLTDFAEEEEFESLVKELSTDVFRIHRF